MTGDKAIDKQNMKDAEARAGRDPDGGRVVPVEGSVNPDGTCAYKEGTPRNVPPPPMNPKYKERNEAWFFMDRAGVHVLEVFGGHGINHGDKFSTDLYELRDDGSFAKILQDLNKWPQNRPPHLGENNGQFTKVYIGQCYSGLGPEDPKDKMSRARNRATVVADALPSAEVIAYACRIHYDPSGRGPMLGDPKTGLPVTDDKGRHVPAPETPVRPLK